MSNRFLVVGGDAAGMSAASKAKRDNPDLDVVVFERGSWVSYGACGLPYYVEGRIASLDDLLVMEPRKIIEERGIDLRRGHEVIEIDREAGTVTVETTDGVYRESYDSLLIATGGVSLPPDVPGSDLEGVFTIRSLDAGRALRDYIAHHEARPVRGNRKGRPAEKTELPEFVNVESVAVIGANKIGIELTEAFARRGLQVQLIHDSQRILPAFGPDVAGMITDHLRAEGVELHLETTVTRFSGHDDRVRAVETDAGTFDVDAVVADVTIDPNVTLARSAGIERGPTGAIATDEFGRTNDEDIYAAGDCAEKHHQLTNAPVHWPYALAANRAGRAVGQTVAGSPTPVGSIVGTLVMKAMDLQVARTGLTEDEPAREAGFDPVSETITTITRAHYYPGWSRMVVHGTADSETGRLLGVSMVAEEGAAHRINSAATAISAGMTVEDVGTLDFGYAPPFGPVWDPVLGIAKVLGNDLKDPTR